MVVEVMVGDGKGGGDCGGVRPAGVWERVRGGEEEVRALWQARW